MKPDLLEAVTDKVGMALIDKTSPENLQTALSAFRGAWNHYFSVYDCQTLRKALKKSSKELQKFGTALKKLKPPPRWLRLLMPHWKFPAIVNLGAIHAKLAMVSEDSAELDCTHFFNGSDRTRKIKM
jgi:hypothetical protein